MHAIGWRAFSALATAAVPIWRLLRPVSRLSQRFVRLVKLRAACRGTIPPTTQFDGPVHTLGRPHLILGTHCRLGRDVFIETQQEGCIVLGSEVWLNTGCVLSSYSRLEIGDHTLIGEYVSIRDAHHGMAASRLIQHQDHETSPITIGSDVWIGRGAAILAGVTIGDGAVVGANAVVTRDVPSGAVVAGVPAKVIRQRQNEVVVGQ